jgi:hypothetical protein
VGVFDASTGASINDSFITGLDQPASISIAGGYLYVASSNSGTVGKYDAATGAVVNNSLLSGLGPVRSFGLLGNDLYVVNASTVGKYDATTGAAINASFVTDYNLYGVAFSTVPEPSTYAALTALAALGVAIGRRRRNRSSRAN